MDSSYAKVAFAAESRGVGGEGDGGDGGAIQRVERVDHPALVEGTLAEVRPPPARAASRSPSRQQPPSASDNLRAQQAVNLGAVAGGEAITTS